jgi:hypothetical protein
MNERIRELAEQQAGAILMDLIMPDSGMPERVKWNVGITSEHLEKFAELIVEECRYVMDCNKGSDQHTEWNRALFETSEKIKEHFGVEE